MSDIPVICSKGHVFWATWSPLGSLTTIRLGPRRFGWCRAGRHAALLRRLRDDELSAQQRAELYGSDD